MIWDDPWISVALEPSGARLPPIPAVLPAGVEFRCWCEGNGGLELEEWADFIRTAWGTHALLLRLRGAWVATITEKDGALRSTCVLRQRGDDSWLLETLTARPRGEGWGRLLMRAVVRWLWERTNGRFVLGFLWELHIRTLVMAWWRGWLRAAIRIERGWLYLPQPIESNKCDFCQITQRRHPWLPRRPPPVQPVLLRGVTLLQSNTVEWSVVVSDSGLGDGWCYVSHWEGPVDWQRVAAHGEWLALWTRSWEAPTGHQDIWHWTGELVVLAALRAGTGSLDQSLWESPAEIAGAQTG